MSKRVDLSDLDKFVTVQEAAKLLGISETNVHRHIQNDHIKATMLGGRYIILREDVLNFKRGLSGRPRTSVPKWRFSLEGNAQIGTSVEADLLEGVTRQDFVQALEQVKSSGNYLFEGTIARYVMSDKETPRRVQFLLIWRETVMPSEEEIEQELAALRATLTHVLAWETARSSTQLIWMHT
jgi:excisionase family DNA binding protein